MTWVFAGLAWGFTGFMGLGLWSAIESVRETTQKMHRIPCSDCQFFTKDYSLKCTVHPYRACTEEAIACRDFKGSCQ
jgi:hypothetical protein